MKDFNTLSPWGALARCVVNPNGTVAYFLNKDNSNLMVNGTPVDWLEVENSGQNVMVQIPKFYYCKKVTNNEGDIYFGVSTEPVENEFVSLSDWEIHPAFYRDRTKFCDDQSAVPIEVDYRYIGAFHGWIDVQNRLRSLPNKTPTTSITSANFRINTKNMGLGWSQFDFYLLYAIQMLYITEYGHPDSQTKIGRGYTYTNVSSIITGGTLNRGNNTFGETTGKIQMSYRGIEDFYGNVTNFIDGIFYDASANLLIGNKGYNNSLGAGYEPLGAIGVVNNGNIREINSNSKAGFIPKSIGVTNTTGGLYDSGRVSPANYPIFGGQWNSNFESGAFYLYGQTNAYSSSALGSRIAY